MKQTLWALAATMALMAADVTRVHAQYGECVPPGTELVVPGAVTDFKVPVASVCRAADYSSSLGPIIDYSQPVETKPVTAQPDMPAAVPRPKPTGPLLGAGEGLDLYDLEAGTGGAPTQYTHRQMERLGELDALQGKPLNMNRAGDLNYLKGYTRGNERRMLPGAAR